MQLQFEIQGGDFSAAGEASSEVKKTLKQLNIPPQTVRRIAVALYESEVNVVAHAYRGTMNVDISPLRIFIQIQDEGPGIPDIDKAMEEGFQEKPEYLAWTSEHHFFYAACFRIVRPAPAYEAYLNKTAFGKKRVSGAKPGEG